MSQNPQSKFICETCDYLTSNKKDYNKHLATRKHQCSINSNKCNPINPQNENLTCLNCEKIYKSRVGLWRHKKICVKSETIPIGASISGASISGASISGASISGANISDASNNVILLLINENKELINDNKDFKNMIMELVKTNNVLQKQMVDVCQKIQPGNTTINSHNNNKTFNLQVFLNEECKDAMNMSDFINSIEIKISDLVNIGKLGYVEGVSNIIMKQLNDTDMNKRPVHCSDAKRETLYVKEENKWEKETQDTKQMLTAVRGVNKKNYQMLHNWKEKDPKCMDSKSKQCDEYMKIMTKVMDGDIENINKVIKKVAKQVLIDK
jgi:uncharacterized protein YxeA